MEEGPSIDAVFGRDEIKEAFAKHRVTACKLVGKLNKKLKAKTRKSYHNQGEIVYAEWMDNDATQLEAADMLLKLAGAYPSQKVEHTGKNGGPIEVNGSMDIGALRRAIERGKKTE